MPICLRRTLAVAAIFALAAASILANSKQKEFTAVRTNWWSFQKAEPYDRFMREQIAGDESETIRDAILYNAGVVNTKMYGPGVFPPLPRSVETRGRWNKIESSSEITRRSVYVFVRRNTRCPLFEAFDMADTHESCTGRMHTVNPTQALADVIKEFFT